MLNVSLFHNWIETIFYHLLSPLTWWVKCYSSVNVNRNPQIFISKKVHLFIVKMIMISNVHFLLCEDYVAATAEVSWQLWNKEECIFGFLKPKLLLNLGIETQKKTPRPGVAVKMLLLHIVKGWNNPFWQLTLGSIITSYGKPWYFTGLNEEIIFKSLINQCLLTEFSQCWKNQILVSSRW